jgi:HD superfamily phosphohydrolase YqeK
LKGVSRLARHSLDQALLEFLNYELDYFLKEGILIHPASVELRNELILAVGHGGT